MKLEKSKKGQTGMFILAVFGVIAILALVVGAFAMITKNPLAVPGTTPTPTQCAVEPTIKLQENDKYDSSKFTAGTFKYIRMTNGDTGAVETDADGSFAVAIGDKITVLQGDANATMATADSAYRAINTFEITKCGVNTASYKELISNTSFTIQCFNEEGNLVNSAGENETIDAGETSTLDCELIGVSKKGMPHGGIMVVEINKDVFDEDESNLVGEFIDSVGTVPTFHTVSNTSNTLYAWDIDAVEGVGKRKWQTFLQADTSSNQRNPGQSHDVIFTLYSKNCFENTDKGTFECGIADQNNNPAGSTVGTFTLQID